PRSAWAGHYRRCRAHRPWAERFARGPPARGGRGRRGRWSSRWGAAWASVYDELCGGEIAGPSRTDLYAVRANQSARYHGGLAAAARVSVDRAAAPAFHGSPCGAFATRGRAHYSRAAANGRYELTGHSRGGGAPPGRSE